MQITKSPRKANAPTKGLDLLGLDRPVAWTTELAFQHLENQGLAGTKRTAERRIHELGLWPTALNLETHRDSLGNTPNALVLNHQVDAARAKRSLVLFAQLHTLPNGLVCLHANNAKEGRYWVPLQGKLSAESIQIALNQLQQSIDKPMCIIAHGELVHYCQQSLELAEQLSILAYASLPVRSDATEPKGESKQKSERKSSSNGNTNNNTNANTKTKSKNKAEDKSKASDGRKINTLPPHLQRLEAESIFIIREAIAQARNPVMLYSIGKDSSVMLELAKKAFSPGKLPFPLLHIDTRWKFQEMYRFREQVGNQPGCELLVHINPDAIKRNINPFDHGSALHTDITKTEGLKQALNAHEYDVIFGGARRDEEKSRAKERIFSFRTKNHVWDPKNQRPELWNLYNTRVNPGESMRVFPLSNWTELDVWEYIYYQDIPVVPLYFSKIRPVVERNGMLLMVDDERFRLEPNEKILAKRVRFRTLGCYPLSGAIESTAMSVEDIILELIQSQQSERQGRAIDNDANASMEKKKQEGYF
jgi:sulfate adenylyltransferase subunit 2